VKYQEDEDMVPGSEDIDKDALLVAYLDGELEPEIHDKVERMLGTDPSLRTRLTAIAEGRRPVRGAYDALLESAPRDRLQTLASALTNTARPGHHRFRRSVLATSGVLLLLLGGGAAGYLIAKPPVSLFEEASTDEDKWVDAVAGEMSLYDAPSMAAIQVDDSEQKAELSKLGQELNLDLSAAKVTLEGLTLKRAEPLQFQGSKLAQLLYASDKGAPVAICIMQESGGEAEREVESHDGLTLAYWSSGSRRFLVIGAVPAERVRAIADVVAAHFG
jgi:anti-sigma factor RsiW